MKTFNVATKKHHSLLLYCFENSSHLLQNLLRPTTMPKMATSGAIRTLADMIKAVFAVATRHVIQG